MKKIMTIVGARPQIIKASAISRAIRTEFSDRVEEIIVHTGQHYDENMSAVFFDELEIPQPNFNLHVGSGSHAVQTSKILEGIENLLFSEKPDALLVYGDTNSTLAGALAASKIGVSVVHIEAGLRSFNKAMPEEINRIACDHVSTLLYCPTPTATQNLLKEGFSTENHGKASIDNPFVYECGDIMFDNSLHFSAISDEKSTILHELALTPQQFILVTIHRNANTDDAEKLTSIFKALLEIQAQTGLDIILPLHPRTRKMMDSLLDEPLMQSILANKKIQIIPPAGFLDIIALEKNARLIVTDSGGLQKEAFFFEKPCVILRPETEWVEIVNNGNALITDADFTRICEATQHLLAKSDFTHPPLFGDGKASHFIVKTILENL
jgi:UDP-GlcNAc3NAcA epimerase